MNTELRKRLEKVAYRYADERYIEDGFQPACDGFLAGAEHGYKEAIALAREWIVGHTTNDVQCNENGEPLADSYIESRKLAIKIGNIFEADMNKLWEEKK